MSAKHATLRGELVTGSFCKYAYLELNDQANMYLYVRVTLTHCCTDDTCAIWPYGMDAQAAYYDL